MKNTQIYAGNRYLPKVICYSVWLNHLLTLNLRDIFELLAVRGINVSYETATN